MDKKGIINEHSKIKLELYRSYLERYLSVLLNSTRFREIHVHDIFSGRGQSSNKEKGSSLLAAIEIQKVRGKSPHIPVTLWLNEKDKDNFANLEKTLEPFKGFTHLSNQDANDYISRWVVQTDVHNLFFIDPHGYTQISTDNLKRLFSMQHCDFLIFIPISHIYRFLRKEEDAEQLKPIANFLEVIGISGIDAVRISNVEDFSDLIVPALKGISSKYFVYKQIIESSTSNNKYGLFFITNNILGADKFLEAQEKIKQVIKENHEQMSFNFVDDSSELEIIKYISDSVEYNNIDLYKIGIMRGILPKELIKQLKYLEEGGKVIVNEIQGKRRNRGGFYVGYKQYKNDEKIITLRLTD